MEQLSRSTKLILFNEALALPDAVWCRLVVGYKRFGTPYRPQHKEAEEQTPPPHSGVSLKFRSEIAC
jgi:hypothetical protein